MQKLSKNIILSFIILFLLNNNILSQQKTDIKYSLEQLLLASNDSIDNKTTKPPVIKKKYSPLNAAIYSAVIPGAGQFYTKSYWKSAAFLGAEIILWVTYASYEKKGDNQTKYFQEFANQHWSVVRYANWIQTNYPAQYTSDINPSGALSDVSQPWKYIDWNKLNLCEEQISRLNQTGFTHMLAPYGAQQYYEMIGKYPQFGGGWDDAIGYTKDHVIAEIVTAKFTEYSKMRGKANDYYKIATTATSIIIANHLISALEAALGASRINKRLKVQGHITPRMVSPTIVEFVPALYVRYEF